MLKFHQGGLAENEENLAPLTAFTLISLLEMYTEDAGKSAERKKTASLVNKLLKNTLPCLEPDETEMDDVYTRALTAYALALAGQSDASRQHIDWLMARAQSNNSLLWWQKPGAFKLCFHCVRWLVELQYIRSYCHNCELMKLYFLTTGPESGPALNVEMTSYVLLSLVKLGSNQDLLKARSIVRWLSKQRNSEGGFVSTQDTVVALQVGWHICVTTNQLASWNLNDSTFQAIAAYASLIGTQTVDMEILVAAGEFENYARIREHDRLVQRRIDLPSPLATEVHIDTVGDASGCAVLQVIRHHII